MVRLPDTLTPIYVENKAPAPYHDTQQVCMKGHQITVAYHRFPQHRQDFCDKCGVPTIYKCPKCETEIRGAYFSPGISGGPTARPDHCHKCGAPYPWTQVKAVSQVMDTLHAERLAVELPPILEKLGLSDRWRIASSALAAFEVMVNRKLEKLNLPTAGDYDVRISRLADALKKQNVPFDAIMISSFRTARVKVLHGGKEPTENELKDIIKYLKTATHSLFPD